MEWLAKREKKRLIYFHPRRRKKVCKHWLQAISEGAEDEEGVVIIEKLSRKTLDPLLSDYSEFYDNDKSDISDLFEKPAGHSRLRGQRTLSEEYGSIRSLSMDNDDPPGTPTFVVQPGANAIKRWRCR